MLPEDAPFTLTKQLCVGTGSVLHKCANASGDSCIAKIFPKTDAGHSLYLHELSIHKIVHSCYVVSLIDYMETNSCYIIVTKDSGENLYDHALHHDLLPETTVRQMCQTMFRALKHLHARNIVHGDVKLENFVIGSDGRIKLIDFGLSEELPKSGRSDNCCGSTWYRSPELLSQAPHGTKTDIWSLAIAVFALVTHVFPFRSDDEYANACEVLMEPPDMEPVHKRQYSQEFCDLIVWMLEKDPKKRPSIDECLESAWFRNKR
jgi:serine/threonine protein kinase